MKQVNFGYIIIILVFTTIFACENKDVNEGEQFKPREIHEDIVFHFDTIIVDGLEYLILEKDNNNPHEGFGFMALRGNILVKKQDTILAYLRTLTDLQTEILAGISERPSSEVSQRVNEILQKYIEEQRAELMRLESNTFQNLDDTTRIDYLPK